MTTDENGYPIITLPGGDRWERGYEFGQTLEQTFPGQDGGNFASAMEYNGYGPISETNGIADLVMAQQGVHDGRAWIWEVSMQDGTDWVAEGGCDYTGWDCQSWLYWSKVGA